jgi:hypothetical protein
MFDAIKRWFEEFIFLSGHSSSSSSYDEQTRVPTSDIISWTTLADRTPQANDLREGMDYYDAPTPVISLANRIGIETYVTSSDELIAGVEASTETGKASIYVDHDLLDVRKRRIVACYIGYLFLSNPDDDRDDKWNYVNKLQPETDTWDIEERCLGYGDRLLMPQSMVRSIISHLGYDVERMAEHFDVSKVAVIHQLKRMGYDL